MIKLLAVIPNGTHRRNFVDGYRGVCLQERAAWVLMNHVQADGDLEACGVLVGRETHEGGILIDDASAPGPEDIREPRAVHRMDPLHQEFIREQFREDRFKRFLGSWHSHSEPIPVPSDIDLDQWHKEVREVDAQLGKGFRYFGIIVGQTHTGAWEVTP